MDSARQQQFDEIKSMRDHLVETLRPPDSESDKEDVPLAIEENKDDLVVENILEEDQNATFLTAVRD